MQLTPATDLDEVFQTLSPEPLKTQEELHAFYGDKVNEVRGSDVVLEMKVGLNRTFGGTHYKAFLMGRSGVGKSTEITRLLDMVKNKYLPIRFSALRDLDPGNFKPFDVLLMMMILVAEKTRDETGDPPPDGTLQQIWDWFAMETHTRAKRTSAGIQATAGAGAKKGSLLNKVLGLFATIKGEVKFTSDRKSEIVEYRLSRISTLLDVANRLLDDCNLILRKKEDREWLLIGEEFDKPNVRSAQAEDLFINYSSIILGLRTHMIFNLPLALYYSTKGSGLPPLSGGARILPDTPIFQPDHKIHKHGRDAVHQVLEARVKSDLFEKGQMTRLIVASGGNLRGLFRLVTEAALKAIVRGTPDGKINHADTEKAIAALRQEYEGRLGESPYDPVPITYLQKAERLVLVYQQDPTAEIGDPVLHSLLHAGAVQDFNSKHWFGVHPLVVDILKKQSRLPVDAPGGAE